MLPILVSHNDDIRGLVELGYAVAFDASNHLIIRDICYLDSEGKLQVGAFVTKLEFVDQKRVKQQNHQVFFAGSEPYGLDRKQVPNLGNSPCNLVLSDANKDVVVQRAFSHKLREKGAPREYVDFLEKIQTYAEQICIPAQQEYGADWLTFRARVEDVPLDSVFKIHDTLSSLAEIGDLSANLKDDVLAIIGLGGTGSYVLDFMIKTPVREIRAFDFDSFHVHNAFRSPGRLDPDSEFGRKKADIYRSRYDSFRNGVTIKQKYIDSSCIEDLQGVTFAFVCVDKGESRAGIFKLLLDRQIPFIDVGIGLKRKDGPLKGTVRTTYYSAEHGPKILAKGYSELSTAPDDLYRTNIQTAELNALNAAFAVIRFKQLRGFYLEELPFLHHAVFYSHSLKTIADSDKP
jgi:molybdopterin/thiamine biosynthesis adenylyltransferase